MLPYIFFISVYGQSTVYERDVSAVRNPVLFEKSPCLKELSSNTFTSNPMTAQGTVLMIQVF
jgi:hypothetical protein